MCPCTNKCCKCWLTNILLRFRCTLNGHTISSLPCKREEENLASRGLNPLALFMRNLSAYVYLMSQLSTTSIHDDDISLSCNEVEGFLVISSCCNETQVNTKMTYPLGPMGRRSLRSCTKSKLHKSSAISVWISAVNMHKAKFISLPETLMLIF